MNNNLPQIRKEGIFNKIKNWFKNIFGIGEIVEEAPKNINEVKNDSEESKRSNFREEIKVKSKDTILALQRKIDNKEVEISDLTDEQLDEMIDLYETQIKEKKDRISYYKEKLMQK